MLVDWLKAAAIDREAGLVKALSQAPLPKKVPIEGDTQLHQSDHKSVMAVNEQPLRCS